MSVAFKASLTRPPAGYTLISSGYYLVGSSNKCCTFHPVFGCCALKMLAVEDKNWPCFSNSKIKSKQQRGLAHKTKQTNRLNYCDEFPTKQ